MYATCKSFILTSNCGRPSAVNLMAVIPVPNVAPVMMIKMRLKSNQINYLEFPFKKFPL